MPYYTDYGKFIGRHHTSIHFHTTTPSIHYLKPLNYFPFSGTISVNSVRTPYNAPGESEILDLDDTLYLGGLPEDRAGLVFPTEVWTALLNYGYVGCVRDLFMDGQSKDIRRLAEAQRAVGVKPSCSKEPAKQCLSNPCLNSGSCREGWNRYVCDCSGTGYLGRACERGESLFLTNTDCEVALGVG